MLYTTRRTAVRPARNGAAIATSSVARKKQTNKSTVKKTSQFEHGVPRAVLDPIKKYYCHVILRKFFTGLYPEMIQKFCTEERRQQPRAKADSSSPKTGGCPRSCLA